VEVRARPAEDALGPRLAERAATPAAAAAVDPARHWIDLNNQARELLEQGSLEEAVSLLEACREAQPEDDVFRRNLAEARFRLATARHDDARLEPALADLARAVELAPERTELAELLARWRREASLAENDTFSPGNYFRVEYDGERKDLLRHNQEILDFLEGGGTYPVGAYETLRGFFRIDPVLTRGERIRIVLYDRREFDELTGLGDWAGGVFDGVIRVAVDDLEKERTRWERILRHELAHAFVRELGGSQVPGWLNEGLAQLLEEDSPSLSLARAEIVGRELFPLERLKESLATWSDTGEIGRAYAQSLVFVAFLRDAAGEDALVELVAAFKTGAPDALGGVPLATHLANLQQDLGG
jgi:tetratricopeptide (TPR) repeat protein